MTTNTTSTLTPDEIHEALAELGATGTAEVKCGGLYTRREENADEMLVGAVEDEEAARQQIEEYFDGPTCEPDDAPIFVRGDRVEGGEPGTGDYDIGTVTDVDGEDVAVAWDSLVSTRQHASALRFVDVPADGDERRVAVAIGTDGVRAVVWGVGIDEAEAEADAQRWLPDRDDDEDAEELRYARVPASRAVGDVDAEEFIEPWRDGWRVRAEFQG